MITTRKLLSATGLLALAALGANPAHAAGTDAGSTITNNVTVNFQVGGVAQTAATASNPIVVDRKINLTVATTDSAKVSVSPGALAQVTTFTVTNLTNATLDFHLTPSQSSTDNFDVTNLAVFVESGAHAGYQPLEDTATFIDELGADLSKTVYVVGDIPSNRVTNDIADVILTATGREAGAAGEGVALSPTSGANTAGMDTVFADGAGSTDSTRNADYSALSGYKVLAAALSAVKASRIVSDGFNTYPNAMAIPGAVVEYCIKVSNAAGGAAATSVAISDTLPLTLTYDASYTPLLNGTVDGTGTCLADGSTTGATQSSGTVSGTIATLAAGATRTLLFRATIN